LRKKKEKKEKDPSFLFIYDEIRVSHPDTNI
jgi:hypothetical protein